jgi:hypothetical protein
MKSGSLNLLEPSGPHRACYGTAVPLPFNFLSGCGVLNQVYAIMWMLNLHPGIVNYRNVPLASQVSIFLFMRGFCLIGSVIFLC